METGGIAEAITTSPMFKVHLREGTGPEMENM